MSPGEFDAEVVRRHLFALDRAVRTLREYRGRSQAELEADTTTLWAIERGLQLCAQNVLDIATHIAASAGYDVPDYAGAIDRLVDAEVLPADFAARFRALAGFRNVLVHGYLEVDIGILRRLLSDNLDDFTEFAARVDEYMRRH